MKGVALALLLVSLPTGPPRAELDPAAARWVLVDPPPILDDVELQEPLRSGLTTTLALRLDAAGAPRGTATVEIRWEPWDEVFHVAIEDLAGRRRAELAGIEALREWWSALRPAIVPHGSDRPAPTHLEVLVIPFSAAEEADTERWFSESLESAGRTSAESLGRTAEESPGVVGRTLGLLLSTSLERRAIARYRVALASPRRTR